MRARRYRNLVVVLGDQLDRKSAALTDFDPSCDAIWMAEVEAESTYVRSHKARIVLFLAAMRHFRDDMETAGRTVLYRELGAKVNKGTLPAELTHAIKRHRPKKIILVEPGDHRVLTDLRQVSGSTKTPIEIRQDSHF
ncbi:MAG: cryptochrome/photolyase family protein, partial [Limisphaerales bacterium]